MIGPRSQRRGCKNSEIIRNDVRSAVLCMRTVYGYLLQTEMNPIIISYAGY
jgi:metal-sulfur cluster biosynthetic enzyme